VRLADYTEPEMIRERLEVLRDKRARIAAYNESCKIGASDLSLLDEKQQATLAFRNGIRERKGWPPLEHYPFRIWKTLGATMQVLEARLAEIKKREMVA
jgi:hypothetical protein